MTKAVHWLNNTLHYEFSDELLFQQALTHRSASGNNNERLEFLGDSVLGFVIAEAVFRSRPNADEGELSKLRSSLVNDASLGALGLSLGLGEHLILGSGEKKSGGHRRESIIADALEAIFGAVFLDRGYPAARELIERVFSERLQNLPNADELRDPKTRLQEWLQRRKLALPDYELAGVSGKDHQQVFAVTCRVVDLQMETHGEDSSRRKAEQAAARRMLDKVSGNRR